jgi:hypothetical protein
MDHLVACHTAPCSGQAIADPSAHEQWHTDLRMAEEQFAAPAYGEVIRDWLDSLDADDVWNTAMAESNMDETPTGALFAELRRRAEAL